MATPLSSCFRDLPSEISFRNYFLRDDGQKASIVEAARCFLVNCSTYSTKDIEAHLYFVQISDLECKSIVSHFRNVWKKTGNNEFLIKNPKSE